MILADFGVAFVIVLGMVITLSVIVRKRYRMLHPPPTTEEEIIRLENELGIKEGE